MSMQNPNQQPDDTEVDPVTRRRQEDCQRHPASNIKTQGSATQCAFCGMSEAAQEQFAAERAAWQNWQNASAAFGGGVSWQGGKKAYP
jgi:hypothetical protein